MIRSACDNETYQGQLIFFLFFFLLLKLKQQFICFDLDGYMGRILFKKIHQNPL